MELLIETSVGFTIKFLTFAGIVLLTWLYYRQTQPEIKNRQKIILALLRFLSFSLIFFLIYKLIFIFYYQSQEKQKVNIFIDNSSSMVINDKDIVLKEKKDKIEKIDLIINSFEANPNIKTNMYVFGDSVRKISSTEEITFSDKITNISNISEILTETEKKGIASILISDGQWNSGISPEFMVNEMDINPIYCIGVGDTSSLDYSLTEMLTGGNIFQNKKNKISVKITRNFFKKDTIQIKLLVNNKQIQTKEFILNYNEISRKTDFDFIPNETGKSIVKFNLLTKAKVKENNLKNNKIQKEYIVYKDKYNVLIMGGIPNPDVKKIKYLTKDFTLLNIIIIYDIIKINPQMPEKIDALILWGFPEKLSDKNNIYKINNMLSKNNIPTWINITEKTDINTLTKINKIMQSSKFINIHNKYSVETNVFVKNTNKYNSVFPKRVENNKFWKLTPPVKSMGYLINWQKEDNVILWGRNNNKTFPVMGKRRNKNKILWISSFENIWRWHSQLVHKEKFQPGLSNFLKNILHSLILNKENEKNEDNELIQFGNSNQIIYPLKETDIKVKVYENDLTLMEQGQINFSVIFIKEENKTIFLQEKYGLQPKDGFNFSLHFPSPGKYKVIAKVYKDSVLYAQKSEDYFVANTDVENEKNYMNKALLSKLSEKTGGKFYHINSNTKDIYKQFANIPLKDKYKEIKIMVRDNSYILIIIILLLNIEWFFRKRWGLL